VARLISKSHAGASLPESYSFIQIQPASLAITAVKISEDKDKRFVVRFFDTAGAAGRGTISFTGKIKNLKETDLLEREIKHNRFKQKGGRYEFNYGKFEILTLSAELPAGK
jgi:alpha-mannosidase